MQPWNDTVTKLRLKTSSFFSTRQWERHIRFRCWSSVRVAELQFASKCDKTSPWVAICVLPRPVTLI